MQVDIARLRFKDWKEIEAATSKPMGWFVAEFQNGMANLSANDLEMLVWVAGKRDNPAFTREEASELGPQDIAGADPTQSADGSPS